jgi:hypothetical protein
VLRGKLDRGDNLVCLYKVLEEGRARGIYQSTGDIYFPLFSKADFEAITDTSLDRDPVMLAQMKPGGRLKPGDTKEQKIPAPQKKQNGEEGQKNVPPPRIEPPRIELGILIEVPS